MTHEKRYEGKRFGPCGGVEVFVVEGEQRRRLFHRVRHSPDGFEWGYYGSGPADLARSLCWDALGHEPAPRVYQHVKERFVAGFDDQWSITEADIRAACAEVEKVDA